MPEHKFSKAKSVGCILGSFDPPHKGHDHMIREIFSRTEIVLLLLPNVHFEKEVQFPRNMTHMQRIDCLSKVYCGEFKDRIGIGIAYEVLFIRLWDQLCSMFPNAQVYFGMGNDVFECFLSSKEYFTEIGRTWSENEDKKLSEVGKHCLVFGREKQGNVVVREISTEKSTSNDPTVKVVDKAGTWNSLRTSDKKLDSDKPPLGTSVDNKDDVMVVRQITTAGNISVPPEFYVSSSHVRSRVAEIRASTPKEKLTSTLHNELDKILPTAVIDFIFENDLYTE